MASLELEVVVGVAKTKDGIIVMVHAVDIGDDEEAGMVQAWTI